MVVIDAVVVLIVTGQTCHRETTILSHLESLCEFVLVDTFELIPFDR